MNVWIPFKVLSKSMYSGKHTKLIMNRNVFEYIVGIRQLFLFEFISKRFIGKNGNGVSRSNKQQIESSTSLSEPVSKFFGNSKDNVSMRAVVALAASCLAYLTPHALQNLEWHE